MLLGCIGDDFTGSSDLANTLSKNGMRTVQYSGIPDDDAASFVEAGVVSLKSRSIPIDEAVSLSLKALEWLIKQGCQQFFFKYCSTFDSTKEGNIGPVIDALIEKLGVNYTVLCPAFPGAGRSVYQGHLFVTDCLLNESGMENHPLTPMTDADIRRWLASQTNHTVGHVSMQSVLRGAGSIQNALLQEYDDCGHRLMVVDAIQDIDLRYIGQACRDLVLVTGGSGVAQGLPNNFREKGLLSEENNKWRGESGLCIALSGSCSVTTRRQVEYHKRFHPCLEIDTNKVMSGELKAIDIVDWLLDQTQTPLAYSSADPLQVARNQKRYGKENVASALEKLFAEIAKLLIASGIKRLLTAGGETSGSVVEALDLSHLEIGPEIDPGVPALRASENLVLALKSGNFGSENYFEKAASVLSGDVCSD